MATVRFAPSARADMSEIFEYIARDKPIAAARWIDTIEEKCDLIATRPNFGELCPEYGADIRCSFVGRYVIFFRPIDDRIEVVRMIAGNRDTRSL